MTREDEDDPEDRRRDAGSSGEVDALVRRSAAVVSAAEHSTTTTTVKVKTSLSAPPYTATGQSITETDDGIEPTVIDMGPLPDTLNSEALDIIYACDRYLHNYTIKAKGSTSLPKDIDEEERHREAWVRDACVNVMKQSKLDDDAADLDPPRPIRRDSDPALTMPSDIELMSSLDCVFSASMSSALNSIWKTVTAGSVEMEARRLILAEYGSSVSLCTSQIAQQSLSVDAAQAVSLTQAPSTSASKPTKTLSPRNTAASPTVTKTVVHEDGDWLTKPYLSMSLTSQTRTLVETVSAERGLCFWCPKSTRTTIKTTISQPVSPPIIYDPVEAAGKSFESSLLAAGHTTWKIANGETIALV